VYDGCFVFLLRSSISFWGENTNDGNSFCPRKRVSYFFIWLSSDGRHVKEISQAVGKSFEAFLTQFTAVLQPDSPVAHMVYRWVGLARFSGSVINPPENIAWLFLYLHQLIYENTALKYAAECGLPGKTSQQIRTLVNIDLEALSDEKFSARLSPNNLKNNKVSLSLSVLLILLRNQCNSF